MSGDKSGGLELLMESLVSISNVRAVASLFEELLGARQLVDLDRRQTNAKLGSDLSRIAVLVSQRVGLAEIMFLFSLIELNALERDVPGRQEMVANLDVLEGVARQEWNGRHV